MSQQESEDKIMLSTSRIEVLRKGKRVGFVDLPEFSQAEASLPGLKGGDRGFAIVLEVENQPAAAIIFPWKGKSIDIAETVHWASERTEESGREESPQPKVRESLRETPSLFQLAGEIGLRRFETEERFNFDFRLEPEARIRGLPFRLEIDDEDGQTYLHCRFTGEPPFGDALVRGSFPLSSGKGDSRADVRFEFRGRGRGVGEGYIRGRLSTHGTSESSRGSFHFWLDAIGPGLSYGGGELTTGDPAGFPFLKLIEQTLRRVTPHGRPISFRIWIGALKYASLAEQALTRRRKIAAILQREEVLTASQLGDVADWLVSMAPQIGVQKYSQVLVPLTQRLQVSDRTSRVLLPSLAIEDLALQFDEAVSAEKRIRFLTAFANQITQAGGRLCFAKPTEESR